MKQFFLKILTIIFLSISIIGCDSQPVNMDTPHVAHPRKAATVWDRLANNSQIKTEKNNPRVQRFIKMYTEKPYHKANLVQYTEQATPYIYYVVGKLEQNGMPSELALLPIIESEYKPHATSNRGAVGIWQIAAMTGRLYGLKRDQWYDGRKDIDAATEMALAYLDSLYEQFNHDWLLALAAYNCGDGRVSQAIRKNKKLGKATDYWSLSLPKETQLFVPKFLAIAYIIQNAKELGIQIAPIANKPYFTKVTLKAPINLTKAADMANVHVNEIKKLNPALRAHTTRPNGPHEILLPVSNAAIFRANAYKLDIKKPAEPQPKKLKAKKKSKVKTKTKQT